MPDRGVAVLGIEEEERLAGGAVEAPDLRGAVVPDEGGRTKDRPQIGLVQAGGAGRFARRRRLGQADGAARTGSRSPPSSAQRAKSRDNLSHGVSWCMSRLNRCAIKAEPKKGAIRSTTGMTVKNEISRPAAKIWPPWRRRSASLCCRERWRSEASSKNSRPSSQPLARMVAISRDAGHADIDRDQCDVDQQRQPDQAKGLADAGEDRRSRRFGIIGIEMRVDLGRDAVEEQRARPSPPPARPERRSRGSG